ncbi:MAG: hypothetical protein IPP35_12455 [Elusimicrobia bacterium]|nr:hypothetical protein [Elusimicrobiota bacterium]
MTATLLQAAVLAGGPSPTADRCGGPGCGSSTRWGRTRKSFIGGEPEARRRVVLTNGVWSIFLHWALEGVVTQGRASVHRLTW